MANTVPGTAHGSASRLSMARRGPVRRRAASNAPARAIATAATVAMHSSRLLMSPVRVVMVEPASAASLAVSARASPLRSWLRTSAPSDARRSVTFPAESPSPEVTGSAETPSGSPSAPTSIGPENPSARSTVTATSSGLPDVSSKWSADRLSEKSGSGSVAVSR